MKKISKFLILIVIACLMVTALSGIAFAARDYGTVNNTIGTSGFTGTTARYRNDGYSNAVLSSRHYANYYIDFNAGSYLRWQSCYRPNASTSYTCFASNAYIYDDDFQGPTYDYYANYVGSSYAYILKIYNTTGSSAYFYGQWAP